MEDVKQTRFGRKAMSLFLSGAMVVAFAPAVAAPLAEALEAEDTVTLNFDLPAGSYTVAGENGTVDALQPTATATVAADGDNLKVEIPEKYFTTLAYGSSTDDTSNYKVTAYEAWYDANANGKQDAEEKTATLTSEESSIAVAAEGTGTNVYLTPVFNVPTLGSFAVNASAGTVGVKVGGGLKEGADHEYALKVTDPAGNTATKTVTAAGAATFSVADDGIAIAGGKYAFELTDKDTGAAAISAVNGYVQEVKMSTKAGTTLDPESPTTVATASVYFETAGPKADADKNATSTAPTWESIIKQLAIPSDVATGGAADGFTGWLLEGEPVAVLKGGALKAAGAAETEGAALAYTGGGVVELTADWGAEVISAFTFDSKAKSVAVKVRNTSGDGGVKYYAQVTKGGAKVYQKAELDDGGALSFSFDRNGDAANKVDSDVTLSAGTYTVAVTKEYKDENGNDKVDPVGTADLSIGEIVLVDGKTSASSFETAGEKLALKAAESTDATKTFSAWTDAAGTSYAAGDEVAYTDGTVTLTAQFVDANLPAPQIAGIATDERGNYVVTFAEPAEGAAIYWGTTELTETPGSAPAGTRYAGSAVVSKDTAKIYAATVVLDGAKIASTGMKPTTETFVTAGTDYTAAKFEAAANEILGAVVPNSSPAVTYADKLPEALAAGKAALEAAPHFQTEEAWQGLFGAQVDGVADQVDACNLSLIETYIGGVKNEDGTVTRLSDSAAAVVKAELDELKATYDKAVAEAKDAEGAQSAKEAYREGLYYLADYATDKIAHVTVPVAVVSVEDLIAAIPAEPAADATDEAKQAYAEAVKAAQDAYGALTEAQQAQVSSAATVALYKAELVQAKADLEQAKADADASAEELAAAQKAAGAAAKKVTAAVKATKPAATVKAGKKKLTVKAAKGTLEKLGKVTYKYRVKKGTKAGGTWKALKAGKTVTVTKLAKGKKYTVQVKATVDGTAAKTFKKTVKVK